MQCALPFVGDGVSCTVDTDGDTYPDQSLVSTDCSGGSETQGPPTYCIQVERAHHMNAWLIAHNELLKCTFWCQNYFVWQDNCPTVINLDQDPAACQPNVNNPSKFGHKVTAVFYIAVFPYRL